MLMFSSERCASFALRFSSTSGHWNPVLGYILVKFDTTTLLQKPECYSHLDVCEYVFSIPCIHLLQQSLIRPIIWDQMLDKVGKGWHINNIQHFVCKAFIWIDWACAWMNLRDLVNCHISVRTPLILPQLSNMVMVDDYVGE